MSKLLLIDGNNLFHRAYHALPPLTGRDGENSNAVYGFSNMLLKALSEVKPSYVACAFDTAAPTFRHIEFEKYKAQRPAPPPDLYPQLPKVKKVLESFGIHYLEKAGYEADDLLATLAFKSGVDEVIILSGDRDALQLVDRLVKVQMPGWNLSTTTLFGAEEVMEKYGVTPEQMVDYKSMIGDVSDNVPGIAGIGPKTAAQLLQKYQTLEGIYQHLDEISQTICKKLEEGKQLALAAKSLVELDRNVDLEFKIDDLRFQPDWNKVRAQYEEIGFKSIINKLPRNKMSEMTEDKKDDQLELI